jgi:hypothetical protein
MDEVQHEFCNGASSARRVALEPRGGLTDGSAGIADSRVAQLLLVLSEIDESVAALGGLPESELRSLVFSAIRACGFTDPVEVHSVVATVLQAIDVPARPRRYVL